MQNIKNIISYSQNLKVLFIEDNIEVRDQLKKLLENFFTDITLSSNGKEAYLQYINFKRDNNYYYDLIITDISMPKINGIELCKKILNINKQQEILIISAHTEKEKIEELNNLGIFNILQKPIEYLQLIKFLSKIIENKKRTTHKHLT